MTIRGIVVIIGLSLTLVQPLNSNECAYKMCLVTWDNSPASKDNDDGYLSTLARILEYGE
jgi:hypothetical protein